LVALRAPGGPRRRAGLALGPAPLALPREALTEDQLAQLRADPMIEIEEISAS
jgi:hypothetical protein